MDITRRGSRYRASIPAIRYGIPRSSKVCCSFAERLLNTSSSIASVGDESRLVRVWPERFPSVGRFFPLARRSWTPCMQRWLRRYTRLIRIGACTRPSSARTRVYTHTGLCKWTRNTGCTFQEQVEYDRPPSCASGERDVDEDSAVFVRRCLCSSPPLLSSSSFLSPSTASSLPPRAATKCLNRPSTGSRNLLSQNRGIVPRSFFPLCLLPRKFFGFSKLRALQINEGKRGIGSFRPNGG